jgi:L-methionine (R)-S-oxide reductase
MVESIVIPGPDAGKKDKYESLSPQLEALTRGEPDMIANVSNVIAALNQTFNFFWIGIYFVKERELVLGPFQGPVACTRIGYGSGVCGTAWRKAETICVDDVDKFPGHIACSVDSKSEIVVPVLKNNKVVAVLDVDSDKLNNFDSTDAMYLEKVSKMMSEWL